MTTRRTTITGARITTSPARAENTRCRLLPIACLAATLAAPALAATADADARFRAGVDAFHAGAYAEALDDFLAAQRGGVRDSNLDFDIGLTSYRLGRYDEAREAFERLRHDLAFTAIADYHLGLVELRLGNRDEARQRLEDAQAMAADPALQRLIDVAIARLSVVELQRVDEEHAQQLPDAAFYALAGAGYDSNPALVSESERPATSGNGSGYVELSGDADFPMVTGAGGTTSLYTDLRAREYFDADDFNQESVDASLKQDWRHQDWRAIGNAGVGVELLGGEVFEKTVGGQLELRRTRADHAMRVRYRVDHVDGGKNYGYLDGWRHGLGVDASRSRGKLRLKADYSLELNDRRDEDLAPEFFSHSPLRNALGITVGRTAWRRMSLDLRLRYRNSRYRDADRFLDAGGTLQEVRRNENLMSAGLRARLRQGEHGSWIFDYQFSRNQANIDAFDYNRHLLLVGFEWLR